MSSFLFGSARRLLADRSGSFAILAALLALPMLGVTGLAIDHFTASNARQRIGTAADAAALAGVTTARQMLQQTGRVDSATLVTEATAAASRAFNANLRDLGGASAGAPDIAVNLNRDEVTVRVDWRGQAPSAFGAIFKISSHALSGSASASGTLASYTNVHVVLDFSASMLIGATPADQAASVTLSNQLNPGSNCAFLCHMRLPPHYPNATYQPSRGLITLRTDVMRTAVMRAVSELKARRAMPEQFRFGVYGFSQEIRQFLDVADARSGDHDHVRAVVAATEPWISSGGGTNFHRIFQHLNKIVPSAGSGATPAQPRQTVILVTDGVDNRTRYPANGVGPGGYEATQPAFAPSHGSERVQNMNPAYCDDLKSRGVDVIVVRVRYIIPSANAHWSTFQFIRDTLEPRMASTIGRCATSLDHYKIADSPEEIERAIMAAFHMQAPTRLTH